MFALFAALPLIVGALLILAARRSRYSKYIALGAALVSLCVAVLVVQSPAQSQSLGWLSVAGYQLNLTFSVMALNKLLLLLVAVVTPIVFLYSIGYMRLPSEQNRFYFEMCAFAAAMMIFAIAGSLLTMFFAWEALGLTSYLLIGFWNRKEKAPQAARRAMTTMIIGDIAFLAAVVILLSAYHTTEFGLLLSNGPSGMLAVALVLLLVAAYTKSAQFPFGEWLADAMEGPTPASALLHSSTMTKAGVFLIAVLLPLYVNAGLLPIILCLGLFTAVIAMMNALSERNIKKILAYSTMEDLALMFIALGLNSLYAALVLFVVQTVYKAVLFMGAGALIKANDGNEDLFSMYNSRASKLVFACIAIGVFSLAGVFPFGGFFGKTLISASAQDFYVYMLLMGLGLFSCLYSFRFLLVPARGSGRAAVPATNYRTLPKSMVFSLAIMAALVIASSGTFLLLGYVGGPVGSQMPQRIDLGVETIMVLVGFVIAGLLYAKIKVPHLSAGTLAHRLLHNSDLINGLYNHVGTAVYFIGGMFDEFDESLDRLLSSGGRGVVKLGGLVGNLENGDINRYSVAFAVGIIILVLVFGFELLGVL